MLTTIKGDISNNTIIVGDFNSPLIPTDRSSRQKSSLGEFKKTQIVSSFFPDHKVPPPKHRTEGHRSALMKHRGVPKMQGVHVDRWEML